MSTQLPRLLAEVGATLAGFAVGLFSIRRNA
jgi:hypothetical protein